MGRVSLRSVTSIRPGLCALGITACLLALGAASALAAEPEDLQAVLGDDSIPLTQVVSHHCHDRDLPVIRCFETAEERDDDLEVGGRHARLAVVAYVLLFIDENYGGVSFTAHNPMPNLGTVGWNDKITSFKSLNGQRPRFYSDANYGTPSWRWAAGAWVSNVGSSANDVISSLRNDP